MSQANLDRFDTRKLHIATIGFILAAFVIYWFSTYSDTFGERDAYRVFVGVLDAFATGKPLASEYVYGYGVSGGYFFLVDMLRDKALAPEEIARLLNLATFVSVAVSLVAVYLIGAILAGPVAGLFSVAALATMPLWYYVGQYAHPMWPALALFLVATVLIVLGDRFQGAAAHALTAASALIFALAMTMRLDVILASPMLLALCLKDGRLSLARTVRMGITGLASLALGFAFLKSLPAMPTTDASGSTLDLLLGWHNPTRFVQFFLFSQLRFARSLNILLIAAALLAIRPLWRDKAYPVLLLTLPTIVLNYIFWIPNAQPERHFLYMAPALALLAGCGAASVLEKSDIRRRLNTAAGMIVAIGILSLLLSLVFETSRFLYAAALFFLVVLLQPYSASLTRRRAMAVSIAICGIAVAVFAAMPTRIIFLNPYSQDDPRYFAGLGTKLAQLPVLGSPLLVVSDGLPIAASMIAANPNIKLSITVPWIHLDDGRNKLDLFIQGWVAESVKDELPHRLQALNAGVFIDPQLRRTMLPVLGTIVDGHLADLPGPDLAISNPPSK